MIVELKALINIEDIHFLQSKNYLVLKNNQIDLKKY